MQQQQWVIDMRSRHIFKMIGVDAKEIKREKFELEHLTAKPKSCASLETRRRSAKRRSVLQLVLEVHRLSGHGESGEFLPYLHGLFELDV